MTSCRRSEHELRQEVAAEPLPPLGRDYPELDVRPPTKEGKQWKTSLEIPWDMFHQLLSPNVVSSSAAIGTLGKVMQ